WSKKERPNGVVVSKSDPCGGRTEGRERNYDCESAGTTCPAGRDVCAHRQPSSLGNLGFEGERGSKRQKHHGPDDARCRARIETAYSLRGTGRGKSNGGARRTDQRAL